MKSSPISPSSASTRLVPSQYLVPFILITSLFFMWGFARATLDVLNKHFQMAMDISVTRSTMVQAMTYLGYFLMALPAGIFITRWGYRRGVVLGLLLFAAGALLFWPADRAGVFEFFLFALFVLGCGLAVLETAANPYASELGPQATAASRLNLAQSFNGLGCILAPVAVGTFIFAGSGEGAGGDVAVPYVLMGGLVLAVALVFTRVKLPEIPANSDNGRDTSAGASEGITATICHLWAMPRFRFGLLALFCYEVSEISINSLFLNYVTADGWMTPVAASAVLSFGALGVFMLARVFGSWVMSRVAAQRVLLVCGIGTVVCAALVTASLGMASKIALFCIYGFEAIMFPTIFALTISSVGNSRAKLASSFLMMTPIGGALGTFLMGLAADSWGFSTAFVVPLCGYAVVLLYAFCSLRRQLAA